MVTTMALAWTVNSTLSWGCNYVMQWNLGCFRYNCQCKRQFARSGHMSEFHIFAASNTSPAQCRPGRMPFFAPFPATTGRRMLKMQEGKYRTKCQERRTKVYCKCWTWNTGSENDGLKNSEPKMRGGNCSFCGLAFLLGRCNCVYR